MTATNNQAPEGSVELRAAIEAYWAHVRPTMIDFILENEGSDASWEKFPYDKTLLAASAIIKEAMNEVGSHREGLLAGEVAALVTDALLGVVTALVWGCTRDTVAERVNDALAYIDVEIVGESERMVALCSWWSMQVSAYGAFYPALNATGEAIVECVLITGVPWPNAQPLAPDNHDLHVALARIGLALVATLFLINLERTRLEDRGTDMLAVAKQHQEYGSERMPCIMRGAIAPGSILQVVGGAAGKVVSVDRVGDTSRVDVEVHKLIPALERIRDERIVAIELENVAAFMGPTGHPEKPDGVLGEIIVIELRDGRPV